MPTLRREPRSEGSLDKRIELETETERCEDYGEARELATTWAEHGDVDRGGWGRTHWAD